MSSLAAATGNFVPSPENLQNACELLTISRNPMDPRYREASQNLENLMTQGEFIVHLTYIFSRLTQAHLPDDVRQLAGLVLKQGITLAPLKALPEDVQQFVKCELLIALSDVQSEMVRKTAGSVITALCSKTRIAGGLAAWPSLLPSLFELLDPSVVSTPEGMMGASGALSCLSKICEDYGWCMDEQTVNTLIPRLLPFFNCGDVNCRLSAVLAMQFLVSGIFAQSESMNIEGHLEAYLSGLAALTSDPDPSVRKVVCQSLIALFDCAPQYLLPVFPAVAEFMLHASQDEDSEVAIAAMDFWIPCCKCHLMCPGSDEEGLLIGLLPRLIPVLLQGMCYTEEEIAEFESESSEDADVDDRPEDLRPIFHKMNGGKGSKNKKKVEAQEGEEEDEEEDEDDEEVVGLYSLQKKSASSLDQVSERFGDPMLPLVLPPLVERLGSGSVWVRVAAVLAFGALQSGSASGVEEYLPQLFPFLMEHLEDGNSKMREMCCWTIGRCMAWAVGKAWVGPQGQEVLDLAQLQQITHKLLGRVSDRNKKVQQYACSTFSIFVEACAEYGCLEAFAPPQTSAILECLFSALTNYKIKSCVIMLDTIGTFTEMLEEYFSVDSNLSALLLQPLMNFFHVTPDTDNLVFPLFECLSAAAASTKLNFQPYALAVLMRCCSMVEQVLLMDRTGALDAQGEPANKQVIASCLDLVDGMVRGLEQNFVLLLQSMPSGGEELLRLLGPCLEDEEDEVRQAALGLLGDLAQYSASALTGVVPSLLPAVKDSLTLSRGRKVCSNAAWVVGELTIAFGDDLMGSMVDRFIPVLATLSSSDECHPNLLENIATTIGRLSFSSGARVAAHVESFIDHWLLALHEVSGDDTRDQTFRGLICLAQLAWESVVAHRYCEFLRAVASWCYFDPPPQDMKFAFQSIISQASAQMQGVDPGQYLGNMEDNYRDYLMSEYTF